MNVFVVIYCFALIGLTPASTKEEEKEHQTQKEECLVLSGLDRAQVELVKEGVISDEARTAVYLFCSFKSTGILNEKAEYGFENMKVNLSKKFNEDVAAMLIEECTRDTFKDGREASLHLFRCYFKHSPKKI